MEVIDHACRVVYDPATCDVGVTGAGILAVRSVSRDYFESIMCHGNTLLYKLRRVDFMMWPLVGALTFGLMRFEAAGQYYLRWAELLL